MTTIPNPEDTRRPGVPVLEVTLADGRRWGLARPSIHLRPIVVEGRDAAGRSVEMIAVQTVVAYPLEVQHLMDALRRQLAMGSEVEQYEVLFNLAAALLRQAHDIDLKTTAALLAVDLGDLARFASEVIAIAFGPPSPTSLAPETEAGNA